MLLCDSVLLASASVLSIKNSLLLAKDVFSTEILRQQIPTLQCTSLGRRRTYDPTTDVGHVTTTTVNMDLKSSTATYFLLLVPS